MSTKEQFCRIYAVILQVIEKSLSIEEAVALIKQIVN